MQGKAVKDYKVGKGKPPKEHQFKPGQSGNPAGKIKGTRDHKTIFNDMVNKLGGDIEGVTATNFEIITHTWIEKAKEGQDKAVVDVLDRTMDKAKQPIGVQDDNITDDDIKDIMDDYNVNDRVNKKLQEDQVADTE